MDFERVKDEYVPSGKRGKSGVKPARGDDFNPFDAVVGDRDEETPAASKTSRNGNAPSKKAPVKQTPQKRSAPKPLNKPVPVRKVDPLYEAVKAFRNGKRPLAWQKIVELMSLYTADHDDHVLAWKLYGIALAETLSPEEAARAFQKAASINKNDAEALNALAWFDLLEGKTDAAVNHMLDALYIEENHPRFKANLERIRSAKDPKLLAKMEKPSSFIFITLPKADIFDTVRNALGGLIGGPLGKIALGAAGVALIALLLWAFYPALVNLAQNVNFRGDIGKNPLTKVSIQDIDQLVQERQQYQLRLSADDVKRKFQQVKDFMGQKQFNRARILVNELLNSNAEEGVKERVGILQSLMPDTDPNAIDFIPQARDVIRLPFMYKDVLVRWSGTVANLEHRERKETAFDLLINFVDDGVVEGIADCRFGGFEKIANKNQVSVIGKIAGISLDNRVVLIGKSVNPIGKEEK